MNDEQRRELIRGCNQAIKKNNQLIKEITVSFNQLITYYIQRG